MWRLGKDFLAVEVSVLGCVEVLRTAETVGPFGDETRGLFADWPYCYSGGNIPAACSYTVDDT